MQKVKRSLWDILKRLMSPLWKISSPSKGLVPILSWALFDVYIIFLFKRVGDFIETQQYIEIRWLIVELLIVLLVVFVIKVISIGRRWPDISHKLNKFLWKWILRKYVWFDNTTVEKIGSWKLISMLKEWVDKWESTLMDIYDYIPNLLIKLAVVFYFLSMMHWMYAVIFIIAFLLLEWFVIYLNTYAIAIRNQRKEIDIARMRFFVRYLTSKFEILQSEKSEKEIQYSDSLIQERWMMSKKINVYLWMMFNIPIYLVQLLSIAALYYARSSWMAWTFSLGLFTGLIAVIWYLTELMIGATQKFKNITNYFTHIEKLRNLLDTVPQIEWYDEWKEFEYTAGNISLKNISFEYEDGKAVLDNFSLDIAWGKKTAFVWVSGSGKSTLVKLISGYIRPDGGWVSIDEQDLSKVSLASYYKNIGYLTQEPSVFDGTIRENLTYAISGEVSDEQLEKCITLAQCDFVHDLKHGLDTEIGERWVRLSWGQRQRLAIAKIFLKDPKILILDEPTSALDSFSEEAITKAMHSLFEWRTVIIIAHRLQTVKEADDIIVLEWGKIVERGTHDGLVKEGWVYATMLELQSWF